MPHSTHVTTPTHTLHTPHPTPHALLALLALSTLLACAPDQPSTSVPDHAEPLTAAQTPPAGPTAQELADALAPATLHAAATGADGLSPRAMRHVRHLLRAGQRAMAMDALRYASDTYTDPADQRAAAYLLGRLLTDDLDPAGLAWLETLPAPFESFDDRRLVWLARALLLNGRDTDAVDIIDALLDSLENGPDERWELMLQRARALHRMGHVDQAHSGLSRLAATNAAPNYFRAEALRQRADWLRTADPDAARTQERPLLLRYPTLDAARRPGMLVTLDDLSADERFARAKRLMKHWNYAEARDEFTRFLDDKNRAYEARYRIGIISLRKLRDDPDLALEMLERVVSEGGKHREDALYNIVRAHMKKEDYDAAIKAVDRYEKRYRKGDYSASMSYYRGWMPYDHGQCEAAIPAFEKHIDRHGFRRSIVLGFRAWCYVRLERWEEAIDAFEDLAERYGDPVERGKAWYWQAYALHQLARDEEALVKLTLLDERYPLTYYQILGQQLAATIDGRDPKASALPWPEGGGHLGELSANDDAMWEWPKLSGGTRRRFARVRRLVELGEFDLARRAYSPLRDTVENAVSAGRRQAFVLFIGAQVEDFSRGWKEVNGKLTMPGTPDATSVTWALAYPRAYAPLVERLADEYDIPSALVYAIMRQESRYRPRQVSGADAVGALQMIPSTAKRVAVDMGVTYDARTFPRPEVGFEYTFHYIRQHLDTWRGQLVPTAASYNGGPTPIGRWIRAQAGKPMAFVIEEFAYNESRIYARKVSEHMLRYLYLYEDDVAARGAALDALFPVVFDAAIAEDVGY